MAAGNKVFGSNNKSGVDTVRTYFSVLTKGNFANGDVEDWIFKLPVAAKLNDIQFALGITGASGTSVDVDVLDDGVSVFTTKPAIGPTATDEALINVGGSGTGLTAPVIDSTKAVFAAGSKVKVVATVNGTYVTTFPRNASITLEFIEQQDFNPLA